LEDGGVARIAGPLRLLGAGTLIDLVSQLAGALTDPPLQRVIEQLQLLPRSVALGRVEKCADDAQGAPVAVIDRVAACHHPVDAAVRPDHAVLDLIIAAAGYCPLDLGQRA